MRIIKLSPDSDLDGQVNIADDHDLYHLIYWDLNKMAAILKMTFSSAFSWMKIIALWFEIHQNLFRKAQLTIG